MAYLNNIMFKFINFLGVVKPTGVWESIIFAFNNGIKNYVWAIVLLTICIKIIMLPLEFYNKLVTRKNTQKQAQLQPQIEILKKKYGNDKNLLNQKTMELYKKNNYNMVGSCLFMFLNIGLTLFIFITLFAGLNTMASYKVTQQYEDLRIAYYNVQTIDQIDTTIELDETEIIEANQRVFNKYNEIKDSWLWIDNIWIADSPFAKPIPSFNDYASLAKLTTEQRNDNEIKDEYEKVMGNLSSNYERQQNGYLILVILAAGITVAQQLIINVRVRFKKKSKTDNEFKTPKMPGNKAMLIILPLLMGFFAFQFNSVFAVYLIISSLFSVVTTPFINSLIGYIEKKQEDKKRTAEAVSYKRK